MSDSVEAIQPLAAPTFDTKLVGKRLEVCWPYKDENGKMTKIWASGTVVRIADGLTDKRSPPRAQDFACRCAALSGHGRPTPTMMSRRVRSGSFCFLRNGISKCSTPGATIRAN